MRDDVNGYAYYDYVLKILKYRTDFGASNSLCLLLTIVSSNGLPVFSAATWRVTQERNEVVQTAVFRSLILPVMQIARVSLRYGTLALQAAPSLARGGNASCHGDGI
jgi:hypothetical protein